MYPGRSASDVRLEELSSRGQLFLNLAEMRQIKKHFQGLKRDPTDCELETIAQTWSEHCGHKTFRGKIKYTEEIAGSRPRTKAINNLLKSTVLRLGRWLYTLS